MARASSAEQGIGQRRESGDGISSGRGEQLDSDVVSTSIQMPRDTGSNRIGITVNNQCVDESVASATG
jgi:hypothetical protein